MELGTIIQIIEIVSVLGGFCGMFVYIGRLLQRLEAAEKRGDALEAELSKLSTQSLESRGSISDVRGEVDEIRGAVKELDVLKQLPMQIQHMSGQVDKIAGTMEKMTSEVQSLKTLSDLKNQMLGLLEEARKDHETRLRQAEAQIRDQR